MSVKPTAKNKKNDAECREAQQDSLRVTRVTPAVIDVVTQRIVEAINPRRIILFGSQARGDAAESSDLDLFVIQDSEQPDRVVRNHIEHLLLDRRFGLDLIVRTPEEVALNVADGNPFYTDHIFGEGIVLYERAAQAAD